MLKRYLTFLKKSKDLLAIFLYNFSPPCLCGKVVPYLILFLSNDSLSPKENVKYTTFPPSCLCGKVVPHFNLFLKNKKTKKVVGNHLAT
jgi:hypothetical protein